MIKKKIRVTIASCFYLLLVLLLVVYFSIHVILLYCSSGLFTNNCFLSCYCYCNVMY